MGEVVIKHSKYKEITVRLYYMEGLLGIIHSIDLEISPIYKGYAIIHIPTGFRITKYFKSMKIAKQVIKELNLVDWTTKEGDVENNKRIYNHLSNLGLLKYVTLGGKQ